MLEQMYFSCRRCCTYQADRNEAEGVIMVCAAWFRGQKQFSHIVVVLSGFIDNSALILNHVCFRRGTKHLRSHLVQT